MTKLHIANPSQQATQINRVMLALLIAMCAGCATTKHQDANKNLFEQALVLQQVKSSAQPSAMARTPIANEINWQFTAKQMKPSKAQKHELFMWFAKFENYSDNPVLLQLGPDWISSYKRGNILRNMVPRGVVIEQRYIADMPKHKVQFSFKKQIKPAISRGASNDFSQ